MAIRDEQAHPSRDPVGYPSGKQAGGRGLFISLEGGEGSGKSTQAKRLHGELESLGVPVVATREPGGSAGGNVLREVLLSGHAAPLGPLAEACVLTSARRDHVETVILPALRAGKTVICDRFADSTRVYQGYVGDIDMKVIDELEAVATQGRMPDITLVFEVSRSVADARRQARVTSKGDADDRFERESAAFHNKVADGFAWLTRTYPDRCHRIDADGSIDEVFAQVMQIVEPRLASHVGGGGTSERLPGPGMR
ncbi:MAG: dTMP kinase [Devosiaceae bacterium]|nr:dTMP kinase [Devosiaceae bacterium MH13]